MWTWVRTVRSLLLSVPLLAALPALAQLPLTLDQVRAEAAHLQSESQAEKAAASYRAFLSGNSLGESDRVGAALALAELLIERAHNEQTGKQAFHREAAALLETALPTAEAHGMHAEAAALLRLQWMMRFQQNRLAGGVELLSRALAHLEEAGAPEEDKAGLYSNLSYTHILTGEFARAIEALRHNVVYSLEQGDRERLAVDYYIIGDAYLKMGELDVARRYFEQSQAPFIHARNRDYFDALSKLAAIDRLSGDPGTALTRHTQVHHFYHGLGEYREVPAAIELARDYVALGDLPAAAKYARSAWSDKRAFTEQRLDAGLVLLEIAQSISDAAQTEHWIDAIDALFADSLARTGSRYLHPLRRIQFAERAIEHFTAQGDAARVAAYGDAGLAVYGHIREGIQLSGSDHLAWASRVEPFISRYVAALYRLDRSRILEVLEFAYATSLIAAWAEGAAGASVAGDVLRLDAYLAAEKAVVDAQSDYQESGAVADLKRLKEAQNGRDQARERYLLARAPKLAPEPPLRLDRPAAPSPIGPGDLFLRYYVRDEVSFVLAVDGQGSRFHALPPRPQIAALIDRALARLSDLGSNEHYQVLAELVVLLPPELLGRRDYRRLIAIPDDVTHRVPFAAIHVGGDQRYTPLGDAVEVLRTYSLAAYNAQRDRAPALAAQDIVIFADPIFDLSAGGEAERLALRSWGQSLARLPYTAREAEAISALYPADRVSVFLGDRATSGRLMSAQARAAKVLHIATHGYFNPATPDIVGIATSAVDVGGQSQRGFLSLTELLSQPFNNNLVVISGCETMLGRSYGGLGVRSLSQGLIAQGAGAVIGTLWKVPDRASSEFMRIFYRELKANGGNAVSALGATRREFIAARRYSAPAYWAAYALTSAHKSIDRDVFR